MPVSVVRLGRVSYLQDQQQAHLEARGFIRRATFLARTFVTVLRMRLPRNAACLFVAGAPKVRGDFLLRLAIILLALCVSGTIGGCRNPHARAVVAPELKGPIQDLAAVRAGDLITLSWTVPRRGMRKLTVEGFIKAQVCRHESMALPCQPAGAPMGLAPGARGTFSESLPAALASGQPRTLYYSVELLNRNGRSTGLSNYVCTLAGAPLPPVQGLTAERTQNGILLRWTPFIAGDFPIVRIHRVEAVAATEAMREGLTAAPTPPERNLLIDDGFRGHAVDTDISKDKTYFYEAQRVARIKVGTETLELAGWFSRPVQITTSSSP